MPREVQQVRGYESPVGKLTTASLQEQWLVTPERWGAALSFFRCPRNQSDQTALPLVTNVVPGIGEGPRTRAQPQPFIHWPHDPCMLLSLGLSSLTRKIGILVDGRGSGSFLPFEVSMNINNNERYSAWQPIPLRNSDPTASTEWFLARVPGVLPDDHTARPTFLLVLSRQVMYLHLFLPPRRGLGSRYGPVSEAETPLPRPARGSGLWVRIGRGGPQAGGTWRGIRGRGLDGAGLVRREGVAMEIRRSPERSGGAMEIRLLQNAVRGGARKRLPLTPPGSGAGQRGFAWGRGAALRGRGLGWGERPGGLEAGLGELAPFGAGLQRPRDLQFRHPTPQSPQFPPLWWPRCPAGSPGVCWPLGLGKGPAPPLSPSVGPRRSGPRGHGARSRRRGLGDYSPGEPPGPRRRRWRPAFEEVGRPWASPRPGCATLLPSVRFVVSLGAARAGGPSAARLPRLRRARLPPLRPHGDPRPPDRPARTPAAVQARCAPSQPHSFSGSSGTRPGPPPKPPHPSAAPAACGFPKSRCPPSDGSPRQVPRCPHCSGALAVGAPRRRPGFGAPPAGPWSASSGSGRPLQPRPGVGTPPEQGPGPRGGSSRRQRGGGQEEARGR